MPWARGYVSISSHGITLKCLVYYFAHFVSCLILGPFFTKFSHFIRWGITSRQCTIGWSKDLTQESHAPQLHINLRSHQNRNKCASYSELYNMGLKTFRLQINYQHILYINCVKTHLPLLYLQSDPVTAEKNKK